MLIRKRKPNSGICFAWLPKMTPEGKVWLEWVHYDYDICGLGGCTYARWVPEDRYNKGERRKFGVPPIETPFYLDDGSTTKYDGEPK